MSKFCTKFESDESNSPTLDEVYDASPLIYKNNNNNKSIYITDSEDSDLPDFKFVDTNKPSEQPCHTSTPEDLIRFLVPEEHMDIVMNDYSTTQDVDDSINRYFDGSIVSNSFNELACKLKIAPIPSDSLHHHDKVRISPRSDDEVKGFSLQFSPPFNSDDFVYDFKQTLTSTQIPSQPSSSKTTTTKATTTKTTTTNRKRQHEPTKQKLKSSKQTHTLLTYTITTTTNFDKHLLAHFKNGMKVSQHNDVTFLQTPSSPSEVRSVQWRCEEHLITPQRTTTQPLDCDYACLVYSMTAFSEEFRKNKDFVEEDVSRCQTKCVLLVYGVEDFFSHLEPGDIPRDTFDTFETYLNIKLHLTVHQANTVLQASDVLVRIMRGVKETVHKKERKFQFAASSPGKGRSVRLREDQTKIWKNQLQQLPCVSARIASAIAEKYPTPELLKIGYSKCASDAERRDLLTNIFVNKLSIGRILSEKIFLFFYSKDPNVKI